MIRKFIFLAGLLAALLAVAIGAHAQLAVAPLNNPHVQFFSASGAPLAGGKLCTFAAGTNTPLATYKDANGTSSNGACAVLDSGGFATVFLQRVAYKLIAYDAANVQQWSVDNIRALAILGQPFESGLLAARPTTCTASTEFYVQTDSPYTEFQCNAAGNGWNVVSLPAGFPTVIGAAGQQLTVNPGATAATWQGKPVFDVRDYAGASIVEQAQAAVNAASAAGGGQVLIPTGTYTASSPTTWFQNYFQTAACGVRIPSDVDISGTGQSKTTINVARVNGDPDAILFCNDTPSGALGANKKIRVHDLAVNWTDTSVSYGPLSSILFCSGCQQIEVDHTVLSGQSNQLIRLLDTTDFQIHHNLLFPNTTALGFGNAAISANRYGGTASAPKMPLFNNGGSIDHNLVYESGPGTGGYSLVVLAQSNVRTENNLFDNVTFPTSPGNSIEAGVDNLGGYPSDLVIAYNTALGGSGFFPLGGVNMTITGNVLRAPWTQSASMGIFVGGADAANLARVRNVVSSNRLFKAGISTVTGDTEGTHSDLIEDNWIIDGGFVAGGAGGSFDLKIIGNFVRNAPAEGILAYGPSAVVRNTVSADNQGGAAIGGIVINASRDGTVQTVGDVSDNTVEDYQANYSTGTAGIVATSTSTTYLTAGSTGRFVYITGATLSKAWTNRVLTVGGVTYPIRAIVNTTHLELDDNYFFASGSAYTLAVTSATAFVLNTNISRFANNRQLGTLKGGANVAVQDVAGKTIDFIAANSFNPSYYAQGSGFTNNYDYRAYTSLSTPALTVSGTQTVTSLLLSANAPTISSGFGTSASIPSNNGTAAFTINVGTGGTASAGVIGLPTAAHGWTCHVTNLTATAANRADQRTVQTASSTTSATVQNQTGSTGAALAWTASDILQVSCFAY